MVAPAETKWPIVLQHEKPPIACEARAIGENYLQILASIYG
jgi:hypothetical protein